MCMHITYTCVYILYAYIYNAQRQAIIHNANWRPVELLSRKSRAWFWDSKAQRRPQAELWGISLGLLDGMELLPFHQVFCRHRII